MSGVINLCLFSATSMAHQWLLMTQLTGCQSVSQMTAIHLVSFALALPGQTHLFLPVQLFTDITVDYKVYISLIMHVCWDRRREGPPIAYEYTYC